MIVGLMPQTGTPVPSCHLYMDDAEYENGTFRLNNITNSGYIFDGEITLMAEKDATAQPFSKSYRTENEVPTEASIEFLTFSGFDPTALAPGTYRIYPAARQAGQETPMPQKNFTSKYSRTALPNGTPPAGKP